MQTLKYSILILVILGGLFFLFGPEVMPENFQLQEILNAAQNSDVIIIFNSGGWGNTPLDKAQDFAPVITGIQKTLYEQGYNSIVVPFNRTKDTLSGKIASTKDFFSSYEFSSEIMAKDLEFLTKNLPDKKIILAGLSGGAAFINKTYEKTSQEVRSSILAVVAGNPFWINKFKSDNILQLDNNGRDTLSVGDIKSLLLSLIKAPFVGKFHALGHDYPWNSPEVNSQIVNFLESKLH